ncbi:T6SS immunity protein Tli3 family protein [Paraburkholderia bannensis]|nr:hypothetical protein [Paraburkholderia bannensis]
MQMKRYVSLVLVGMLVAVQAACTAMIPDAVRAEMSVQPVRSGKQDSDANWYEYVVYRIDDHRFITIRSPQKCDGHLDGNIYYNDTHKGVRTFVSFTGSAANGLYRGYYAVNSDLEYIAIPSLSFSQTRGMMLHINYSHDGGHTFRSFILGNETSDIAVLVEDKNLFLTTIDLRKSGSSSLRSVGVRFDISQNMESDTALFNAGTSVVEKYGRDIYKIPPDIKSPSGEIRWSCPLASMQ